MDVKVVKVDQDYFKIILDIFKKYGSTDCCINKPYCYMKYKLLCRSKFYSGIQRDTWTMTLFDDLSSIQTDCKYEAHKKDSIICKTGYHLSMTWEHDTSTIKFNIPEDFTTQEKMDEYYNKLKKCITVGQSYYNIPPDIEERFLFAMRHLFHIDAGLTKSAKN